MPAQTKAQERAMMVGVRLTRKGKPDRRFRSFTANEFRRIHPRQQSLNKVWRKVQDGVMNAFQYDSEEWKLLDDGSASAPFELSLEFFGEYVGYLAKYKRFKDDIGEFPLARSLTPAEWLVWRLGRRNGNGRV